GRLQGLDTVHGLVGAGGSLSHTWSGFRVVPYPSVGFRKGVPSDHGAGSGPRPAQETTAMTMRLYTGQHRFYCGIDLHARLLAVCVLDQAGAVVYRRQLPAEPQALLDALAPFRPDVVVSVECLFAWYWVADLCRREG